MAYDRPSWKEIDKMRDGTAGRRGRRRSKNQREPKEHSTRYDRYKADLNRLFDQGLAGELLKKPGKDNPPAQGEPDEKPKASGSGKEGKTVQRRKGNGRVPPDASRSASRFKLIRSVADARDSKSLCQAIDELVECFGLPDDWVVLIRVLEHPDEALVQKAVARMIDLRPQATKIPRRASLKERLRTIGQTASDSSLRQMVTEFESKL